MENKNDSMLPINIEEQTMSREVAEVQASIFLAKKFPRDEKVCLEKILIACQRPLLAEAGIYAYARGGSSIDGGTIRLAEAIGQLWGNMDWGLRELEQRDGESTVESYAWDKENNVRQTKIFQVAHIRELKGGKIKKLTSKRDIYEQVANQGARRMRSCMLAVIPGDILEAARAECEKTMLISADNSPEAVTKMLEKFEPFKVTKMMIEKRIQRNITAITPAHIVSLRKIYNSLKDGMAVASDWFEDKSFKESMKDKKEGAQGTDAGGTDAGNPSDSPSDGKVPTGSETTPVSLPSLKKLSELLGKNELSKKDDYIPYINREYSQSIKEADELSEELALKIIKDLEV